MSGAGNHNRWDLGLNYIMGGHDARISVTYSRDNPSDANSGNRFLIGLQFQL